jgi:hypothetical protein
MMRALREGQPADVKCCGAVMTMLRDLKQPDDALKLLQQMNKGSIKPDVVVYHGALQALAAAKRGQDVEAVLEQMRAASVPWKAGTLMALARGWAMAGSRADVCRVFEEMAGKGVVVVEDGDKIVARAVEELCQSRGLGEGMELLRELGERGVPVGGFAYDYVLREAEGRKDAELARGVWKSLMARGTEPLKNHMRSLMNVFVKARRPEEALHVLEVYRKYHPEAHPYMLKMGIYAADQAKDANLVRALIMECVRRGVELTSPQQYRCAFKACLELGDRRGLDIVMEAPSQLGELERHASLARLLLHEEMWEEAAEALGRWEGEGLEAERAYLDTIMAVRERRWDDMWPAFERAEACGGHAMEGVRFLHPSVLQLLNQDKLRVGISIQVLLRLFALPGVPSLTLHNAAKEVFKLCAQIGRPDLGVAALSEMRKNAEWKAQGAVMDPLLEAYAAKGQVSWARALPCDTRSPQRPVCLCLAPLPVPGDASATTVRDRPWS